ISDGGEVLFVNKTVHSPVSSCTLLCMAVHNTAMQSSVLTVKHKHSHTVTNGT
ncbi:unnamed protein product, partial [Staurois parvus]